MKKDKKYDIDALIKMVEKAANEEENENFDKMSARADDIVKEVNKMVEGIGFALIVCTKTRRCATLTSIKGEDLVLILENVLEELKDKRNIPDKRTLQ
jgi:hypothetical protein